MQFVGQHGWPAGLRCLHFAACMLHLSSRFIGVAASVLCPDVVLQTDLLLPPVQMMEPNKKKWSDAEAVQWCLQLAKAVAYLHSRSPLVIHRDLKLENVLLRCEAKWLPQAVGRAQLHLTSSQCAHACRSAEQAHEHLLRPQAPGRLWYGSGRLRAGCAPALCAQQAEMHSAFCLLQLTVGLSAHQQPGWAHSCNAGLAGTAGVCLLNPVRAASSGQCCGFSASITRCKHHTLWLC